MSPRVTLDTNVLVSGMLIAAGPSGEILDAWVEGRFTLVTSLYQVEELVHVLSYPRIARRLNVSETEMAVFIGQLLSRAVIAPGALDLPGVTRDPKDDFIVACAVEGEAQLIVSGDQDLLALGQYAGIRILSPRAFLQELNPSAG